MAAGTHKTSLFGRIKLWLRQSLLENLSLKLFSFLIALLLWIFVFGNEDVTKTVEVPVFFMVPEGKFLVSDVPDKIKIAVSGPWAALQGWDTDNLRLNVDLSKFELGPSVVYFEENRFRLPPTLTLNRVNPSEVAISLAVRKSKMVRVVPVTTGTTAAGYVVKSLSCDPESITVEGGEGDIMIVDEVLTEEIDVSGKKESFQIAAKPVRLSRNIFFPRKDPIMVMVTIKKDLTERTFNNVPVVVRNTKYVHQVKPSTIQVTVMGPRLTVDKLSEEQVVAFIDASKEEGDVAGTETVREVEFDLSTLPQDVKLKAGTYTARLVIMRGELSIKKGTAP